jgi:hypothetical protein
MQVYADSFEAVAHATIRRDLVPESDLDTQRDKHRYRDRPRSNPKHPNPNIVTRSDGVKEGREKGAGLEEGGRRGGEDEGAKKLMWLGGGGRGWREEGGGETSAPPLVPERGLCQPGPACTTLGRLRGLWRKVVSLQHNLAQVQSPQSGTRNPKP